MRTWRTGLMAMLAATGLVLAGCQRSDVDDPAPARHRTAAVNPEAPALAQDAGAAEAAAGVAAAGGGNDASGGGAAAAASVPPIVTAVRPGDDGKLPVVSWDLREDRSPSKVGWPKDSGGNKVLALDGDFQFSIRVHDEKDFAGRVRHVETRRSAGLIEGVEITEQPAGTDAAYSEAKAMLGKLGFGEEQGGRLQAWYTKAKAGNYDNLDMAVKNSYNRVYTVHVINDGTSELPWSVGLDIDWSKVCGCHG